MYYVGASWFVGSCRCFFGRGVELCSCIGAVVGRVPLFSFILCFVCSGFAFRLSRCQCRSFFVLWCIEWCSVGRLLSGGFGFGGSVVSGCLRFAFLVSWGL